MEGKRWPGCREKEQAQSLATYNVIMIDLYIFAPKGER